VHQVLDTPADVVHLRADLPNLHADGCGGRGGVARFVLRLSPHRQARAGNAC
jgi:hypothetical protein